MTSYETLNVTQVQSALIVTLNRPEKRNALNVQMCIDLRQVCLEVERDASIQLMLIEAAGPVFSAGADLAERKTMSTNDVRARRLLAFAAYDAIEQISKPTISLIDGPAIGSGAEIATACDFAIGTEKASFRYPEVSWGTIGATQRLPEIVGRRIAKDLLFTGRKVDAQESLRLGLITQLIQSSALGEFRQQLIDHFAQTSERSLRLAKKCVDDSIGTRREAALGKEIIAIETLMMDDSWKEKIKTF